MSPAFEILTLYNRSSLFFSTFWWISAKHHLLFQKDLLIQHKHNHGPRNVDLLKRDKLIQYEGHSEKSVQCCGKLIFQ